MKGVIAIVAITVLVFGGDDVKQDPSKITFDEDTSTIQIPTNKIVMSDCPNGFEHHGDSCYKASGLEASWIEAKMYCRVIGGELAIIQSATEEAIVEGMLNRLHGSHIDDDYWISGSDIVTENDWRWMGADGQSWPIAEYTNWGAGTPDNNGGQENCLVIHYRHQKTVWNDADCNVLHSFICEVGYMRNVTAVLVG